LHEVVRRLSRTSDRTLSHSYFLEAVRLVVYATIYVDLIMAADQLLVTCNFVMRINLPFHRFVFIEVATYVNAGDLIV